MQCEYFYLVANITASPFHGATAADMEGAVIICGSSVSQVKANVDACKDDTPLPKVTADSSSVPGCRELPTLRLASVNYILQNILQSMPTSSRRAFFIFVWGGEGL